MPLDLFTWREISEADAAAAAADQAWEEAQRKLRVAPHGQVRQRQARTRAAAHDALRAELAASQLLKAERS